jgi:hypothetical protein
VLVIEVDDLDPEPLKARLARRADIVGIAAHAEKLAVGSANVAELGCQKHLVALAGDGPADQLLVPANAVHVGGIQERDAALDRVVDRRDRFFFAAAGVEFAHPHAAEPDRRYFGSVRPQSPFADLEHS